MEEAELLQAKAMPGRTPELRPNVASGFVSKAGGSRPLPASVRDFFEPRFGHDFGQVRIYTSAQAAESARAVNAKAFAVGRDVVFGAGKYAPTTAEGQRLLAHELTHVAQQGGWKYQNRMSVDPFAVSDNVIADTSSIKHPDILQRLAIPEKGPASGLADGEFEEPIAERPPGTAEGDLTMPEEEWFPVEAEEPEELNLPKEAKNIRFSELESEAYQGFDPTTRPDTLVVPVGGTNARRIAAKVRPADAVPNLEIADTSVAAFSLSSGILEVTGLAKGTTTLSLRIGDELKTKLSILVPPSSISYTVDFLYLHQTAGPVPGRKRPREARATSKSPGDSASFTTRLRDVIEKQTSIGFSTGRSEIVKVPDDLSPVLQSWFDTNVRDLGEKPTKYLFAHFLHELKSGSASTLTILFLWDLTGDAEETGGFAIRASAFAAINDQGCSDGSELPHEVVHLLTPGTYPSHDKRGLMASKCPAVDSPRILSARVRAMHGM